MFAETLQRYLGVLGVELSHKQINQLEEHFNLLTRWNKALNLTRIGEIEATVQRHYCESIFLGIHLPGGPLRIVDVGSGGGFPGIPVAVFRSDCSVALVEAHQRKAVFLREATRGLRNTLVIPKRAEEVSEAFDWAASRAVNYHGVQAALNRMAPNIALLSGEDSPNPRFTWNKIKLPWGNRRFLWLWSST